MEGDLPGSLSQRPGKFFGARQQVLRAGQTIENHFERRLRILFAQAARGPVGDFSPLMKYHDPLAEALDDVEDMRAEDDRASLARERGNQSFDLEGGVGVETIEGLIEKNHARPMQQSGRDNDLLFHPLAEGGEVLFGDGFRVEIEKGGEALDLPRGVGLAHFVERRNEPEVFAGGQRLEKRARFGDVTDDALDRERIGSDVVTEDQRATGSRAQHPDQHFDRRCLAGAIGAE